MILQITQFQQTAAARLQNGNTQLKQFFTFLLSTLLLLFAQVLSAQTWTGAANSNWNNPANWSTMTVPNAASNVEIVFGPNKPVILAGTAAVAKSVFVEIGSELTINAVASLSINGATNIGFFNLGTVTNDGTINIGNVSSITNVGLQNDGIFKNNAKIRIGDVATVGKNAILSNGTFENTTANGEIHINRTSEVALKVNYGTFKNEAKIQIGATASVGEYGIQNKATFENKTGGDIQIDRTSYTGLYNEAGTFSNAAKITMGAFNSPGYGGITNYGDFYNIGMGEINIDRATLGGLYNYAGLFSNAAKIRIGAVALTGQSGVYNLGNFENKTGGEIQIDRTTQVALAGAGGSFTNAAKIKIGSIASIGNVGISNNAPFTNNLGGDILIDRVVEYGIQHHSGNFINYDKITIGGNAAVGITGIYNEGAFFNNSNGDIKIDRCSEAGFVNFTGSSCSNTAKITIGSVASVGDYGIQNKATFENKTGGEIQIDRTLKIGLYNETGTFNNKAKIFIGSVADIGATGLENKSIFNNTTGSEIKIDRFSVDALRNLENASFDSYGKIYIGTIASIGGSGIINNGNFSNNIGGDIKVERFKTFGVYNYLKSFSNAAKITIDGSGSPAYIGLDNFGTFTNTGSSEITIDHVGGAGLRNLLGVFTNEAKIFIGNTGSVGNYGLMNFATFKNTTANAEIQIDRTIEAGFYNETGTFNNQAKITIGSVASVGEYGMQNKATFENKTGGDIQIDRAFYAGLFNEAGTFTNAAKITMGAFNAPGQGGLANSGDFYNIGMGEINIDRATLGGLYNYAGLFSNAAKIRIGAVALTGQSGIYNLGNFENKTGGEIQIDRTTQIALACGNGSFKNAAKIKIGSIASVGNIGINSTTLFTNNLGGDIQIDRTLEYAIYHLSSDFINLDKITIGSIATVGLAGIYNKGSFFNNTDGDIKIDRFSDAGFINFTGSCSNTAKITIGAATAAGPYSVTNNPNATFVNSTCAILSLFGPVKNQSNFYQNGLLSVITPNQHINTGYLSNNGIIVYPNGNPIPSVANFDIIVLPISSNCGSTIANALQLGSDNDYAVNTTWYKDAAMTLPAGTYNQATNIFTLTSLSAPLYISIQSFAGGCTRRVPIFITANDNTPPTITCPANIVRNTDPNQCYATVTYTTPTATDNCAAPTVAIVPPSLASGAQFPKGVNSVTWQATDGAGLTHRCTFTVTVNGGAGSLNITCPANQIKSTDLGQCSAVVTYVTPTATDNCGGNSPVVTWVSGGTTPTASGANSISTFQKGVTTVQWKATDASNTTKTCTFRVTINDTQLPSITCPTNQTLATTGSSCASATFNYAVTATDNCMPAPTVIRTSGLPSGSSFPKGTSNVTWRAIDGAGNSKTCSFSVTVADNVLPTITCPTNVAVTAAPGQCSATAFYPNPTATDNCAVQSLYLLSGLASGSMYPQGVTNNVWVATDNSGQSATCVFTVTVTCGSGYGSIINDRAINDDIQGANSEITMRLSPNPAITSVAVALEGLGTTGGELIVMDTQGKSVWQQVLTNTSVVEQISVSEFTAGIYFVMLRSDRGVVTKRLVVNRD